MNSRSLKGKRVIPILVSIVLITLLLSGSSLKGSNDVDGLEDTGSEIVERDFDVQFMIEPSSDPLDPLFGEKWGKMNPGSEAMYLVIISNTGPVNDTFFLELNEPPRDYGWDWYFEDDRSISKEVTLTSSDIRDVHGGISYETFKVKVICPIDASKDTHIPVRITARPIWYLEGDEDSSNFDQDELFLTVGHVHNWPYFPQHPTLFYARNCEWLTIPLTLSNLGTRDVIEIEIFVESRTFWSTSYRLYECHKLPYPMWGQYNWTYLKVNVSQGESYKTELKFRPDPEIYGSDDIFQFRYVGRIVGSYLWEVSPIITVVIVKNSILFTDHNESETVEVAPGQWSKTNISIENTGWQEDTIEDVYLVDPKGVDLRVFNETGGEFHRMEIAARSKKLIEMEFLVDRNTPPGPIDLQLMVEPFSFDPILLNVTLDVQPNRDVELISSDPILEGVLRMGPGEEKRMVVGIRNNGNTKENVFLDLFKKIPRSEKNTISSLDDGWNYRIEWASQVIEPTNFLEIDHSSGSIDTGSFVDDIGYVYQGIDEGRSVLVDPAEIIWMSIIVDAPDRDGAKIVPVYPAKLILSQGTNITLDEMDLALEVLYPDLSFEGPLFLYDSEGVTVSSAEIGEKVFFKINVSNSGHWYSRKVRMSLKAGDMEIDRIWIEPLGPGQFRVIGGNFTVTEGIGSIEMEIDPANEMIESEDQFMVGSSEDANIIRAPLDAIDDEEGSGALFILIAVITSILILVLVLISVILYLRKKWEL